MHKNGSDVVPVLLVTGERNPRIVVALRVLFERGCQQGIFSIRWVLRYQCRTTSPSELE